ncbi:MAG: insulinase family protein [Deltaproteobacteria bacterium]|nr:insulinase family protein [Deltaproteobacteria bacterium]
MKRVLFFFVLGVTLCGLWACHQTKIPFFKPVKPVYEKLSNGFEIFFAEDHELPLVQLQIFIRGGSVYDPKGKEGLTEVAMQLLRLGGSKNYRPHEIENQLEYVGASLEMGADEESEVVSLSILKKDLDLGLKLLFDLLQNPTFDSDQFQTIIRRRREALKREKEDPLTWANREYSPFVYGAESLWGRRSTIETIDRITLEDVRDFHRRLIQPQLMVMAAAGDLSEEKLSLKIQTELSQWTLGSLKAGETVLTTIPPLHADETPATQVLSQKGLSQSTIMVGHLTTKRTNPDKFALQVMNFILGGSGALTSRLGEEIRSSSGKAYSVWSEYGFGPEAGIFRAVAQTSLENTEWVLNRMKAQIEKITTDPKFSRDELDRAKQALLRSLIFRYERRFDQVRELARFHIWGYPDNYFEILQKGIQKVGLSDIERVAREYLHPDHLKVLMVTDETTENRFKK